MRRLWGVLLRCLAAAEAIVGFGEDNDVAPDQQYLGSCRWRGWRAQLKPAYSRGIRHWQVPLFADAQSTSLSGTPSGASSSRHVSQKRGRRERVGKCRAVTVDRAHPCTMTQRSRFS
ncbi:hypothetical protein WJX75_004537 [Coccomyxa subellipsoidea]|uniref:Secreted protein n=1 Tax=Coccomyxa subellipsoidea TaxID=248742 RepID=A0ABR2Z0M9_9CHLO